VIAWSRRVLARLLSTLRPGRADTEFAREVRAHLQLLEDEFIASGMPPEEAYRAARRAFGGVEQTRERQRDSRSFTWLSGWSMDLRLGGRMLRRSPGLTTIAMIALTVAIGAGVAYLEFVNDFARPRLAFPGSDRLVGLVLIDAAQGRAEPRALHEFSQWAPRLTTLRHLGITHTLEQNLIGANGVAEPVRGAALSTTLFRAVPVPPLHGRLLAADDEAPGAPAVALLGEELWRSRFGGDPAVVGRTVTLGGVSTTVVGIMPASFGFPVNNNVWTPSRLRPHDVRAGEGPAIRLVGQLAPGVSIAAAQAELTAVMQSLPGDPARPTTARVQPYVESLWTAANQVTQMQMLYGINVLFLALVGVCATNVATLVFARTMTREGEIAIRTALGASRARIAGQMVAEALVLTSLAAVAGLTAATAILRTVRDLWTSAQGSPMPFWWNEQLGAETLLYGGVLVVGASLIIGGIPAFKATGPTLQSRLKTAGTAGASMQFGGWWTSIVIGQVAVTVVFLMAVVALVLNSRSMGQKFEALSYPHAEYLTAFVEFDDNIPVDRRRQTLTDLSRRLDADPGITASTYVNRLWNPEEFWLEFAQPEVASSARPPGDVLWVRSTSVGERYFETFGQLVKAGRTFTPGELMSGAAVAVVDETFVQRVLGGRNPLGLQVRQPASDSLSQPGPWIEIVGVVTDLSTSANKTTEDASLYQPMALGQEDLTRLVVHSRAQDVTGRLRAAAFETDPDLRLAEVMTMDKVFDAEIQTFRFFTVAIGAVAAVALLLSTAGVYALVSFTLSRRVREIGIRRALGAGPRQVVVSLLRRVLVQIAAGILLGSLPGIALVTLQAGGSGGRWTPVVAVCGVALLLLTVAAATCLPLVRRAIGIQPIDALRGT
jgi:predicted permease